MNKQYHLPLAAIPASVVPALLRYVEQQSANPTANWRFFVRVAEHAEQVISERQAAMAILERLPTNAPHLRRHFAVLHEKSGSYHQRIYQMYMLGDYVAAANLLTTELLAQTDVFDIASRELLRGIDVDDTLEILKRMLDDVKLTLPTALTEARVKTTASTIAKQLRRSFALSGTSRQPCLTFSFVERPYDLFGCRVVLPTTSTQRFLQQLKLITELFKRAGIVLRQHRWYSTQQMHGSSLIGVLKSHRHARPVQLQVWDARAANYERLSYGNYKANGRLVPIISAWQLYCDKPLSIEDHALLTLRMIQKIGMRLS